MMYLFTHPGRATVLGTTFDFMGVLSVQPAQFSLCNLSEVWMLVLGYYVHSSWVNSESVEHAHYCFSCLLVYLTSCLCSPIMFHTYSYLNQFAWRNASAMILETFECNYLFSLIVGQLLQYIFTDFS